MTLTTYAHLNTVTSMVAYNREHKVIQQFLLEPTYKQFISEVHRGITTVYQADLRKHIYPAFKRMLTQQCTASTENFIKPLIDAMAVQQDIPQPSQPQNSGNDASNTAPANEKNHTVVTEPIMEVTADDVINSLHRIDSLTAEHPSDPRKRRIESTELYVPPQRRKKIESKKSERNTACVLGDTPVPQINIMLTCNESIHNFLKQCGCDKCFEALRKRKYDIMKAKESSVCALCTKFLSFDSMCPPMSV